MVHRRHFRRQDSVSLPSGSGIASVATTASSTVVIESSLVYDHKASQTRTPPLVTWNNPSSTTPTTSVVDASSPPSSDVPTAVAASSTTKPIALSTVIATCVGAFIGVTALIIFSFCVYRRYTRSLTEAARARGPLNRNKQASEYQRRSRFEYWNKLNDTDENDKWYQTKESNNHPAPADVTPMEKLSMFKKAPSVHTAYTSTDHGTDFSFPSSYAEFDPNLAATLKGSSSGPQPLLKTTDIGKVSWSESKVSNVSVSRNMAIPTPPPTVSYPHKWEAAEVVHYSEGQSAEVVNPSEEEEHDERKSYHNPFFAAKDYIPSKRQRSNSASTARSQSRTRSRANSTATQATVTSNHKGKERMRNLNVNPFDDIDATHELPRPTFISHVTSSSVSSMDNEEKERALKSLVALLNVDEDEVRDRLRIASMQPSIISGTSSLEVSDVDVDVDMTDDFPFPPSMSTTMRGRSIFGR